MQSKNRSISIIVIAIAVLAFSTISFGQDTKTETTKTEKATKAVRGEKRHGARRQFGRDGFAGRRGMMARGRMHGFALGGINLSDAQKEQIKALRDSNKPDQAFRDEVRSLIKAKKDGTITADQTTRLKAIREEGAAKRKAIHDQIQNILTAEQKATIEARKAEMKARMQERRQKFEERRKEKPTDSTKPIK